MTTSSCDFHDSDAWKALKRDWEIYAAKPTAQNKRQYFGVAVPRWRRERDG